MFERYTENARRALFFARYEASEFGDQQIKAEHLLLGLIRVSGGLAAPMLAARGISTHDVRREIEKRTQFGEKLSTSVEIPFYHETKMALQFAAEEADRLRHDHIGTEHLLLGLLREEKSAAATILKKEGLRLPDLREAIATMVAERPSPSHRTEVSALIHGLNQLLDRLSAIASGKPDARPLLDDIRQQVAALERQLGGQ